MSNPTLIALIVGVVFLAVGVMLAVNSWRAQHGTLPYGSRFGFRLRSTLVNTDTWVVAHGAIVMPFWLAAVICWVNAFGMVFFSTWMNSLQVAGMALLTLLVLVLLWFTTRGAVAARARAFQREHGNKGGA